MKKSLLIALLFTANMPQLFAQAPTIAKENGVSKYSNNQILTMDDMVFNKPVTAIKKVPLDTNSILIYDYDGELFSYNLVSEKINWRTKATDADRKMCGNKLTINNGIVYVPFINGEIYALNNQTGAPFWKTRLGNIKNEIIIKNQAPVIVGNNLYLTTQNGNSNIYALDIKDGGLIWNYRVAYPYNHLPVLYFNDKIFTQSAPNFYSFEAKTGKALYQRGFKKAMYGKAVTDGKNVFIADEDTKLFALSPDKLDLLWQFDLPKDQYNIGEKIFCQSENVFFASKGSDTSLVYAVKSETGKLVWKTDFKGQYIKYISPQNEFLWGYTESGLLFKLDLKTGKTVLQTQLKNLPISNIEFKNDQTLLYYCQSGLVQFDVNQKTEAIIYLKGTITYARDAFIKLIR
ncbi:MAG: pyrrolo-quinoline quinone [Pedobacter sp.]|nr:MAG: pyrrolo-quinoline quinone [Pedobacter sp.]